MKKFNELYESIINETFSKPSQSQEQYDFPGLEAGFKVSNVKTAGGAELSVAYGLSAEDEEPTVVVTYWSDKISDPLYFVKSGIKNSKELAQKVEKLFGTDDKVFDSLTRLGLEYEDNGAFTKQQLQDFIRFVQFSD